MNSNFMSKVKERKDNNDRGSLFSIEEELEERNTSRTNYQDPQIYRNSQPNIRNSQPNIRNPQSNIRNPSEPRAGMSGNGWKVVFTILEVIMDIIKGVMIVGGVIAANLADFLMGSIGVSLLVNKNISNLSFVNGFGFGSILSMGSSAIQIYMWSLIQKRDIKFSTLLNPSKWKTIPKDVQGFLAIASFLWIIDTLLDVSPMFVLFTSENYGAFPVLYNVLIGSVAVIVIILCGFAEILTSNMRKMFEGA